MPGEIKVRERGNVTIVDSIGRMTMTDGSAGRFREAIEKLRALGRVSVILSFERNSFVDSVGLGEMVAGRRVLSRAGGNIKLLHPTKRIKGILKLTTLDTIFEIFDDEDAAVRSFG